MAEQSKTLISADEYRQLPEKNQFQELINGEIIVPPSPMSPHQRLIRRISRFIEDNMPGGEVLFAPMDVYFNEDNVLQPDVFWMADDSTCIERGGYFYGAPELIVEVHSPSTITQDKREKFEVYQASGVKEYWMVDPAGKHIEVWQRKSDKFERTGIYTEADSVVSLALDKTLQLKHIFGDKE